MKKLTVVLVTFVIFAVNSMADKCYNTFYWDNIPVEMTPCLYSSGGSGYIVFENLSNKDIEICWTIHYYDGYTNRGCKYRFKGNDKSHSSNFHLSKSKIQSIEITKFRYH